MDMPFTQQFYYSYFGDNDAINVGETTNMLTLHLQFETPDNLKIFGSIIKRVKFKIVYESIYGVKYTVEHTPSIAPDYGT